MESMDEVVDGFIKALEVDYISLSDIAFDARVDFGAKTTDEALRVSLDIVRRLYEKGLRPGDYCGPFNYWPEEGCAAMLDRIAREWTALGEDPNPINPICWFGPEPTPAVQAKNAERTRQFQRLDALIDKYLQAAQTGSVTLSQIVSDIGTELGMTTRQRIRQWGGMIASALYQKGLRPGSDEGGSFNYWPDEGYTEMVSRITNALVAAGEDPSPTHPVSLARMPPAARD